MHALGIICYSMLHFRGPGNVSWVQGWYPLGLGKTAKELLFSVIKHASMGYKVRVRRLLDQQ